VRWWPAWSGFPVDCRPSSEAFDVHLEDRGMVDQSVDSGQGHGRIWEDPTPFTKGLICRDQHGPPFVSSTYEFEQYSGLSLILGDVSQVVEDEQMVFLVLLQSLR